MTKKDEIKKHRRKKKVHSTFFSENENSTDTVQLNDTEDSKLHSEEYSTSNNTVNSNFTEPLNSPSSEPVDVVLDTTVDSLTNELSESTADSTEKLDPKEIKRRLKERSKRKKKKTFLDKYPEKVTIYLETDVKEVLYLDAEAEGGVTELLNRILKEYYGMR